MENQRKSKGEKGKKAKTKLGKFEEIGKSVEMKRVAERKELLDKGDGLATAAGARRNNESIYVHIHESSLSRLTVVFRRT